MNKTIKILAVPCMVVAMLAALTAEARPGGPGGGPGRGPGGGFGGGPGGGRPFEGPHGGGPGGGGFGGGPGPGGFGGGPGWEGGRHHHGWCSDDGWALGAGLIGGAILGAVLAPDPVIVTPAPVVVSQPVVYTPAPVVVQQPVAASYYQNQVRQVWVEGRWISSVDAYGGATRVWQPGHYENQTVQVLVTP